MTAVPSAPPVIPTEWSSIGAIRDFAMDTFDNRRVRALPPRGQERLGERHAALAAVHLIDALATDRLSQSELVEVLGETFEELVAAADGQCERDWRGGEFSDFYWHTAGRARAYRDLMNECWRHFAGGDVDGAVKEVMERRQGITDHL